MNKIPEDQLQHLKQLGAAYYEARHAAEMEYLNQAIDPATYTKDGALDRSAYLAGLTAVKEYVEKITFDAQARSESEPDGIWRVVIFGGIEFECRRRIGALTKPITPTISIGKRQQWFSWFVTEFLVHKIGGGSGVTAATLRAHEAEILADDLMWEDVLWRHNLLNVQPWDAKGEDTHNYMHALGNFWGMIMPYLRPRG